MGNSKRFWLHRGGGSGLPELRRNGNGPPGKCPQLLLGGCPPCSRSSKSQGSVGNFQQSWIRNSACHLVWPDSSRLISHPTNPPLEGRGEPPPFPVLWVTPNLRPTALRIFQSLHFPAIFLRQFRKNVSFQNAMGSEWGGGGELLCPSVHNHQPGAGGCGRS